MAHGVIRFMAVLPLLACRVEGLDTAGCMLHVRNFDHAKLTRVTWTAEIAQNEYIPEGVHPFKIRIEFNSVGFGGSKGTTYVGAMIQNVGHSFPDDVAGRVASFPALGVYLSSLRPDFPDSSHGVRLNVDPAVYPKFGRVFENIDGLGFSAKNVYTRQNITPTSPNAPVRITWTVTRRSVVTNPVGNFSKALNNQWIPLSGPFVIWNFSLTINGASYDVADYFLPIEYAEYILRTDPLVLHQEYFGSATQILDAQKGEVRYTNLVASDGAVSYPLNQWSITWRIDDEAGNLDQRFGWKSDRKSLTSVVGHQVDTASAARDVGHSFILFQ